MECKTDTSLRAGVKKNQIEKPALIKLRFFWARTTIHIK